MEELPFAELPIVESREDLAKAVDYELTADRPSYYRIMALIDSYHDGHCASCDMHSCE